MQTIQIPETQLQAPPPFPAPPPERPENLLAGCVVLRRGAETDAVLCFDFTLHLLSHDPTDENQRL